MPLLARLFRAAGTARIPRLGASGPGGAGRGCRRRRWRRRDRLELDQGQRDEVGRCPALKRARAPAHGARRAPSWGGEGSPPDCLRGARPWDRPARCPQPPDPAEPPARLRCRRRLRRLRLRPPPITWGAPSPCSPPCAPTPLEPRDLGAAPGRRDGPCTPAWVGAPRWAEEGGEDSSGGQMGETEEKGQKGRPEPGGEEPVRERQGRGTGTQGTGAADAVGKGVLRRVGS